MNRPTTVIAALAAALLGSLLVLLCGIGGWFVLTGLYTEDYCITRAPPPSPPPQPTTLRGIGPYLDWPWTMRCPYPDIPDVVVVEDKAPLLVAIVLGLLTLGLLALLWSTTIKSLRRGRHPNSIEPCT